MGLNFPCGREMEALALKNDKKVNSGRPSVLGYDMNLSGIENKAKRLFEETGDESYVSSFVFDHIAKSLIMLCDNYVLDNGETEFLFAGGVMSNSLIKKKISEKYDAGFAEPSFSSDNAVGIALLARKRFISENDF